MMDIARLESEISQLPLYYYGFIDPKSLEFSERIRYICGAECPMYNKTWACPPAVGEVKECEGKCKAFENCLLIGTITEDVEADALAIARAKQTNKPGWAARFRASWTKDKK